MWNYSAKVLDHFNNPRNVGEVENADGRGEVGSLACGDALTLTLKVDDQGRITDAKFMTFGCGSAIASASVLTEMIKGKTLDEALQITNQDIANALGGLPEEKMHCSVMGREALEAAIADYRGEKAEPTEHDEGPLVCRCFGVTEDKIRRAIRENNLTTVEQVTNYTKAGGGCTSCLPQIEDILREELGAREPAKEPPTVVERPRLTNIQKMTMIQDALENEIAPALRADGGGIELVDIDGNTVFVRLTGQCVDCPASELTLRGAVEARLRELVTPEIVVEEAAS